MESRCHHRPDRRATRFGKELKQGTIDNLTCVGNGSHGDSTRSPSADFTSTSSTPLNGRHPWQLSVNYANALRATKGIEFEFQKDMRIHPFRVPCMGGNASCIESSVRLCPRWRWGRKPQAAVQIHRRPRIPIQPSARGPVPYILNGPVGFEEEDWGSRLTLLQRVRKANHRGGPGFSRQLRGAFPSVGPLCKAGARQEPDLGFNAKNLLNPVARETQGSNLIR